MAASETLRSVIDAGRSSRRLDELSSARVIAKIALQIHAAQQKAGHGTAVGPVTPAHIKLAPNGEATLELGGGSALGYSSPEQIAGAPGDRRSDVFSLGTVLWEALTHARLFDAMNDAAVRVAVQDREILAPAEINANVPAELSAICMRALSRNPTDRYQSLKAMAVEIEEFLEEAGYEDNDSKIAQHLAVMYQPKQVKIAMAPLKRPATSTPAPPITERTSGTQPPPSQLVQPAQPSMLGEPPTEGRKKSPSGAALAAALANAGAQPGKAAASGGLPQASAGLPQAASAATAVGVPKLAEWQDSAPPPHAPPPAAAPIVAVDAAAPTSAASSAGSGSVAVTPQPPVLPARNDRQTIVAGSVPIPRTAVDAKHVEAKQPALIVEDKKPALIVEDKPPALIVDTPPPGALEKITTLVDAKPPEIEVPKLVDGKLPAEALPSAIKPSAVETLPVPAVAAAVEPVEPPKPRAPSHTDMPHPANAVSLGPIPGSTRDSKDVLAGWGWGTDKHDAIPPDSFHDDDDFHATPPDTKKTLVKLIGGGLAVAALVTIVAIAFGGSSKKKQTAAKQQELTQPAIDRAAPVEPAPAPEPPPAAEPAVAAPPTGSADAAAEQARLQEEAAKQAAAQDAERLAAEQAKAQELAAQEAAKQDAARVAADKEAAKKQELAKQEAAKQEAARVAADKKAEQLRIAAEKKAEQQRLAAEKQRLAEEKKRAAAAAKAEQPRKTQTTPKTAKTTTTTPKKTETVASKPSKADAEAAYRTGLQQFARGDTSGALASLRTSLAGNPSHAPTWRGLGLVFEKMGERDQARAAFKRYLQLAPSAGDADQIRSRLERLGS